MSENNVNQVQPASAQVPAQEPKRVRVGFIFLSFVPVAVLLVIQTISQMPFMAIAFAEAMEEAGGNIPDYVDLIIKMSEVLEIPFLDFIGLKPKETDIHGCIYINGKPVLVNSKEDIEKVLGEI